MLSEHSSTQSMSTGLKERAIQEAFALFSRALGLFQHQLLQPCGSFDSFMSPRHVRIVACFRHHRKFRCMGACLLCQARILIIQSMLLMNSLGVEKTSLVITVLLLIFVFFALLLGNLLLRWLLLGLLLLVLALRAGRFSQWLLQDLENLLVGDLLV